MIDYAKRLRRRCGLAACLSAVWLPIGACNRQPEKPTTEAPPVLVYCSVDEPFARQVFAAYRERTGRKVSVITDSEAGKTTGLVNKIIAEAAAGRPRADVFWSGELFNTIRLARQGLLDPYDPPTASDIPPRFKDPKHHWTALAVRARVIAFDPGQVSPDQLPTRWEQLAEPRFASRTAIANPLFGTTYGHVAAMFALWGPQRARTFLQQLHDHGVQVTDGNSVAVRSVMARRTRFACTDTDDVWVAQRSGATLDLRYLDMGNGGTLLIPCSVALVRGSPNPQGARHLVDYLVSAEVERMLAQSASRNIPVRASLRKELGLAWPPECDIPFDSIADAMDEAAEAIRDILLR